MPDSRSDEIAREAARLMQTGRVQDIEQALRRAADSLKYERTPLPGHGRVRIGTVAVTWGCTSSGREVTGSDHKALSRQYGVANQESGYLSHLATPLLVDSGS